MRRILFLSLVCLLAIVGAEAKSIVFNIKGGTKVYYQLGGEVNPMMRFVDGKITVNADVYELSNIVSFYLSEEDAPTGITSAATGEQVKYAANTLIVADVKNADVKVYSLDGKMVEAEVNGDGDNVVVDLNSLKSGAYVVSVAGKTFKVMKK